MRTFIIKTVIIFVMLNLTFFTGIQIYKFSLESIRIHQIKADCLSYDMVLDKVLKLNTNQRESIIKAKIIHEASGE